MGTELNKTYQREALNPEFPNMPKWEWESRIKKARGLMEKRGLDAIMILTDQDSLYFFGYAKPYKSVFPGVGIIPREGSTILLSNADSADVVDMEGYVERNIGYRGDNRPTATAPDPVSLVVEVVEELDLKTIGMEFGPFMWWDGFTMNEWERFKSKLPEVEFVDATDLIWEMRMIKSDWEIEVMRRLYQVTCKGYFQIINNARPGVNEKELFYDALRIWIDEGIVSSGYYPLPAMTTAHSFRDRILKEGDWILLDGGPSYKGYVADIQRMIYIGDPGKETCRMAKWAYDGQKAAEEILKPGITAGDIWTAGVSKVAEGDPEIWRKVRSRRLNSWAGHGQGLNIHEPPYLIEGSDEVIKEGMIISIEIPSFDGKKFVNMPEDTYLITEDGFDKLTKDFGPGDIYVKI